MGSTSGFDNSYSYNFALDKERKLLFVSDEDNDRVTVFDYNTITDNEDAVYVLGQPDFTTSVGQTTQNGFNNPMGITFDSEKTDNTPVENRDCYRIFLALGDLSCSSLKITIPACPVVTGVLLG